MVGIHRLRAENTFLLFYEPESLHKLVQQIGLQSGVDIWEPSEHIASMIRPVCIRPGQFMMEFLD
ncbi:MAG: hypothetical protein DRH97_02255 [Chloroflexi bacterium]|nr:MAG: hypothetical protein DRH97_02255 [Chloroflexota bacterium]